MTQRVTQGFIGGCIGAIVLVIIMYIMQAMGMMEEPAFVSMYKGAFGDTNPLIAAILFILSGGVWGAIYGLLVKHPTIGNAMLFGFLPTLWLLVPVNAYLGKPLFNGFDAKGIIMPIIFNVVIWGIVLGLYMRNRVVATTTTRDRVV